MVGLCCRAMQSPTNKEVFLKQFEQIVEGVKQNKARVSSLLTLHKALILPGGVLECDVCVCMLDVCVCVMLDVCVHACICVNHHSLYACIPSTVADNLFYLESFCPPVL